MGFLVSRSREQAEVSDGYSSNQKTSLGTSSRGTWNGAMIGSYESKQCPCVLSGPRHPVRSNLAQLGQKYPWPHLEGFTSGLLFPSVKIYSSRTKGEGKGVKGRENMSSGGRHFPAVQCSEQPGHSGASERSAGQTGREAIPSVSVMDSPDCHPTTWRVRLLYCFAKPAEIGQWSSWNFSSLSWLFVPSAQSRLL